MRIQNSVFLCINRSRSSVKKPETYAAAYLGHIMIRYKQSALQSIVAIFDLRDGALHRGWGAGWRRKTNCLFKT